MLTYTFSTREKIMLAVLAFVAIVIAWYQLVFVNIQNEIASLDSQIAAAQDEATINQSRTASLTQMRQTVQSYIDQGIAPITLPTFDNTQNLMAYLHGVLGATQEYSISFDQPAVSEDDGTVHRSGNISYTTGSYAEARAIAQNISRGPYPCEINALGITDNSAKSQGSNATTKTNLQVTFFEKVNSNANLSSDSGDNGVKGNDLSTLSQWNNG